VQDGGMGSCAGTLDQLIDTYCAAWSDPDPMRRREILERVWADGATYTDPRVHAVGLDELLVHIDKVVAGRPGAKVVRTSRVDAHHDVARFAWHVVQAGGTALPESLDVVELSADGRIQRVIGFFGPLTVN
jgi:hypothetical protein